MALVNRGARGLWSTWVQRGFGQQGCKGALVNRGAKGLWSTGVQGGFGQQGCKGALVNRGARGGGGVKINLSYF
jgi:hypothetical protein